MKVPLIVVGVLLGQHLSLPAAPAPAPEPGDDWIYLENAFLRLGVLRSSGAGIAFLAPAGSSKNLLNHFDRGRLVQQSFYGDADGSLWAKQPWRYNPVQGGDYRGQGARTLELRHDATSLYAKTVPRHWATGEELAECVLEEWITLEGALAHVRFQMTYSGRAAHQPHHQEIPAIFLDASLANLVTYEGTLPWTGAPLTWRSPGPKNEYYKIPENWVAYVSDTNFGVGAWVPAAQDITCYRFLGAAGSACSYVAPITTFALKPGTTFRYEAYFAIGSAEQIRKQFAALHGSRGGAEERTNGEKNNGSDR